jgi:receptor expression-enhancing protein 1/2/3/4
MPSNESAGAGANLETSSIPTFVFPVFASYKALKTSDPALLTPWLMYWVVLACALLVESWVGFILVW